MYFGTGLDYWWVYDSSNTQFELNSTNCDGAGTDCIPLILDDGTDDFDLNPELTVARTARFNSVAVFAGTI